ncbi:MAG: transposase [bacterium]
MTREPCQQEKSAYNGHFATTCYHPLLLFNREGDCLAVKLRPENVHSAEHWDAVLLPEIYEALEKLGRRRWEWCPRNRPRVRPCRVLRVPRGHRRAFGGRRERPRMEKPGGHL